jgi:hypothetical protein
MNIYAGIGAKKTPNHILSIMRSVAEYLAAKDWILNTGAAPGADQTFAEGALKKGGTVNLFIPWPNYEKGWIKGLHGNVNVTVLKPDIHTEAINSVYKYHPAAKILKNSVLFLHARNYLVLENIKFAVCYTSGGKVVGGTGQSIRILNGRKKNMFNLGNNEELQKIRDKL